MCYNVLMDIESATLSTMSRYIWRFSEWLEERDLNPYKVARHAPGVGEMQTIYRLAREGGKIKRLDLNSLGMVIDAIEAETGQRVTPNDLLTVSDTEKAAA